MTSGDYFFRWQRTFFNRRQSALWGGRLPLGTSERRPSAARLQICVAAVFQRISGMAPPRQRTNAGGLLLFGHASKLIYEGAYWSPRFRTCTDCLCDNFLAKVWEISWKLLRVILFTENSVKFLKKSSKNFRGNFAVHFFLGNFFIKRCGAQGFFLTDLEGVIHSRFTPQPL